MTIHASIVTKHANLPRRNAVFVVMLKFMFTGCNNLIVVASNEVRQENDRFCPCVYLCVCLSPTFSHMERPKEVVVGIIGGYRSEMEPIDFQSNSAVSRSKVTNKPYVFSAALRTYESY